MKVAKKPFQCSDACMLIPEKTMRHFWDAFQPISKAKLSSKPFTSFHLLTYKTHFHMNCLALDLSLKGKGNLELAYLGWVVNLHANLNSIKLKCTQVIARHHKYTRLGQMERDSSSFQLEQHHNLKLIVTVWPGSLAIILPHCRMTFKYFPVLRILCATWWIKQNMYSGNKWSYNVEHSEESKRQIAGTKVNAG